MENNTVFVLLAGGKSERMGSAKGLLNYQNTCWILEQLNRINTTTLNEVYIGLGFNYKAYFIEISWFSAAQLEFVAYKNLKVRVVINRNPEVGSFSTLQTVLKQIPINKSVLINPIDIPLLNTKELQNIIDEQNCIVLPNYEEKNGHPIKLNPTFWNPLLLLNSNDNNSRLDLEIKKANPSEITKIAVTDNSIVKNLNTPLDWNNYSKTHLK